jgi:tRNA(Ile)-lysidine synthase
VSVTRVLREVRRFAATAPGVGVVAVSGGADSVALLRALHAAPVKALVVAHVNHRLRGADSDADEAFVRELCTTLGVECRVKSVDVSALAAGDNLESTARRVRYEFFATVAQEIGAAWIATAHTADDQAETVLHRLIRGTGLQGLRGIAAERVFLPSPLSPRAAEIAEASEARHAGTNGEGGGASPPGEGLLGAGRNVHPSPGSLREPPSPARGEGEIHLLRPLLALTRADVLAHLAAVGQPHREDASNADTRFTRNRIRHELLPLLKTFNPDIVSALAHLAEHAAEAHEVITSAAAELLAKAERPRAGSTIILDAATLGSSRALIRALLRLVWEREGWPVADMTFDAWDRAVEVAECNVGAWDFPGGVSMRHEGRVVQITRRA